MTKEERKKQLLALNGTIYGEALKEELKEQIAYIESVRDTKSWEETQGRKFALKVLEDIFAYLIDKKTNQRNGNQYE